MLSDEKKNVSQSSSQHVSEMFTLFEMKKTDLHKIYENKIKNLSHRHETRINK